jgi:hypothetical protein
MGYIDLKPVGWHDWTGQAEDGYPNMSDPVYKCPGCGKLFCLDFNTVIDHPGFRDPSDRTELHAECCGAVIGSYDSWHDTPRFDFENIST